MKLSKMTKEELELLSYNDITNLLLEENGKANTIDLFKQIVKLLDLPSNTFENKIGDYYTSLSTDKRFILLEGLWDLKSKHKAPHIIIEDDDEIEEEVTYDDYEEEEKEDDDIYSDVDEDDDVDDVEEYKNLAIIDEKDLDNIE